VSFETQLASDLGTVFLNTGEFSVSATYTPTGGNATTVKLIFDNPDLRFDPVSGVAFEGSEVKAHAKRSDFSAAVKGEPVVVSGTTYYIREIKNGLDSGGITELGLSTQAQHG
jgi:hypothetical protein